MMILLINSGDSEHNFYIGSSIEEGKTYFISDNLNAQKLLNKVLGIDFEDNIGIYSKIIIRKEVIKKILKVI